MLKNVSFRSKVRSNWGQTSKGWFLYLPRYKDQEKQTMGFILNGRPLIEYSKALWDHWDPLKHDGVRSRSGHQRSPYLLPQCGHAIHVFGPIWMQNSTAMLREAYLTDFRLNLQSRGQGQVTRGQFWKFIFLDKWHMFWDQFCLRNTIKAIKSVHEVILGHKWGHYWSTLKTSVGISPWALAALQTKLIKLETQNLPWMCTI